MKTGAKVTLSLLALAAAGGTAYALTRKSSDEEVVRKAIDEVDPGKGKVVKNMSSEEIKTVAFAINPKVAATLAVAGRGDNVMPGEGRGGENAPTKEEAQVAIKNMGIVKTKAAKILIKHGIIKK